MERSRRRRNWRRRSLTTTPNCSDVTLSGFWFYWVKRMLFHQHKLVIHELTSTFFLCEPFNVSTSSTLLFVFEFVPLSLRSYVVQMENKLKKIISQRLSLLTLSLTPDPLRKRTGCRCIGSCILHACYVSVCVCARHCAECRHRFIIYQFERSKQILCTYPLWDMKLWDKINTKKVRATNMHESCKYLNCVNEEMGGMRQMRDNEKAK